jgi:hypothetical protein
MRALIMADPVCPEKGRRVVRLRAGLLQTVAGVGFLDGAVVAHGSCPRLGAAGQQAGSMASRWRSMSASS